MDNGGGAVSGVGPGQRLSMNASYWSALSLTLRGSPAASSTATFVPQTTKLPLQRKQ